MKLVNQNILIVGLQAWYTDIGSNCKSIAMELAKHNKVIYVNMPLDRNTFLHPSEPGLKFHKNLTQQKEEPNFFHIQDGLYNYYPHVILESINQVPFTSVFQWLNKRNNKRFALELRALLKRENFDRFILFNDNDIFRSFFLKDFLNPLVYIYYSRDNLVAVPYWKKHGKKLEPLHIKRADIALANSTFLTKRLKEFNPRSYFMGQGCNLELFNFSASHPVPTELKDLPRPLVGYVGAINKLRLDPIVLNEISDHLKTGTLVLVGPEDEYFTQSSLKDRKNVKFCGKKPLEELPSYIEHFDVCINPQLLNEVTIGNYPLKVDEYLAMGKPVVATKTEAMDMFDGFVYLAENPAQYSKLIEQALNENSAERTQERIRFAQTHTWKNAVAVMENAINEFLNECK